MRGASLCLMEGRDVTGSCSAGSSKGASHGSRTSRARVARAILFHRINECPGTQVSGTGGFQRDRVRHWPELSVQQTGPT